jgi:hypothetical protein
MQPLLDSVGVDVAHIQDPLQVPLADGTDDPAVLGPGDQFVDGRGRPAPFLVGLAGHGNQLEALFIRDAPGMPGPRQLLQPVFPTKGRAATPL